MTHHRVHRNRAAHRTMTAVSAALLLAGLVSGCNFGVSARTLAEQEAERAALAAQATAPPEVIEVKTPRPLRFYDVVRRTEEGLKRVDIMNWADDLAALSWQMYGRTSRFVVDDLVTDGPVASFCVLDRTQEVWYASRVEMARQQGTYLLGDGQTCTADPERAFAVTEVRGQTVTHTTGSRHTRLLLDSVLRGDHSG